MAEKGTARKAPQDDTLQALRRAAKGLLYISESDRPVKALAWPADAAGGKVDKSAARALAGAEKDAVVSEMSLEQFFAPVAAPQDWHGEEEQKSVAGFQALRKAVEERLTDARVFRIGDVTATLLLVGRTAEGGLAGLKTEVVET